MTTDGVSARTGGRNPNRGGNRPSGVRSTRHWLVLTVAVALAGCGGYDDGTHTEPDGAETALTVTLDPGDGATVEEWTLTCDPPDGTHPNPPAACATLDEVDPEVLEPVPPDQACTQIYGGPQMAVLSGSWHDEPVETKFSRENGCEIMRWDAMAEVLGDPGGVRH